MNAELIKTKRDYESALKRFRKIFHAKQGTKESDEAELLALLIERYEDEHFHIEAPDPVEAIKFMMEQMDLEPKDVQQLTNTSKSTISRILNYKMPLSLALIRKLHETLKLPYEALITKYDLQES